MAPHTPALLLSAAIALLAVASCAPRGGDGDESGGGSPTAPTITYTLRVEPATLTITTREGGQLSVVSTPEAPAGTFWAWTSSNNQAVILANANERDTRVLCNNNGTATATVVAVSIRNEPSATATITCNLPSR